MIQINQNDIHTWISRSVKLFIKKLSQNECIWADGYGHQNGVYIPREIRETNFFPALRNVNEAKPHIFESQLPTFWPATGEYKLSNLKHYSNKGSEMHFTGVPKEYFAALTPASLLIGGVMREQQGDAYHWFMVIDSASEEAEFLESVFDLDADFHFGLFEPEKFIKIPQDEAETLIVELKDVNRKFDDAMVLSAKTTLRERWKQITMEQFNSPLFLATVDDRVSSDAIDDMSRQNICLVVPESLKDAKETCYKKKENVITFRSFFDEQITIKRPLFRQLSVREA